MAEVWYTIEPALGHRFNSVHPERPERVRACEKHLVRKLNVGDIAEVRRRVPAFQLVTGRRQLHSGRVKAPPSLIQDAPLPATRRPTSCSLTRWSLRSSCWGRTAASM